MGAFERVRFEKDKKKKKRETIMQLNQHRNCTNKKKKQDGMETSSSSTFYCRSRQLDIENRRKISARNQFKDLHENTL